MIDETDIKFFVWDRLDDTIEQIFEDLAYDELKTETDRLYKKFDELIDEIRKLKKENSFTEGDRVYFTGGKHYD